ncbi:MAG: hypothetical protein ACOVOR_01675 [Rhabdochlamydiaceae bacterium]
MKNKPLKSLTKDEMFLVRLHEIAKKKGDPMLPIASEEIGQTLGLNHHAISNIVRHLAQANFVKKDKEKNVWLTPQGIRLLDLLFSQGDTVCSA